MPFAILCLTSFSCRSSSRPYLHFPISTEWGAIRLGAHAGHWL